MHGVEGTWFATQVVWHVRVADVTKMSTPSDAALFAIVTEPESSEAVALPARYRAPPSASAWVGNMRQVGHQTEAEHGKYRK